jgi:hypothetical protein
MIDLVRKNSQITDEPGRAGTGYMSMSKFAAAQRVQEVMTTSDFGFLADLVDRGTMAGYMDDAIPTTYETIGYRRDTQDLARAGANGRGRDYQINAAKLVPMVFEKGEYLPTTVADTYYEFRTFKYGWQWDLSWEAWMADGRDLGMLQGIPQTWGLSARYTREYMFTVAFAADPVFFTEAQGNLENDAGGALSITSLMAGVAAIQSQTDPAGNIDPYAGPLYLVVPPALAVTAQQIVGTTGYVGGTTTVLNSNPAFGAARVVVNHFLPVVDTVQGNTGWYLFAEPRLRPAVRYGYLRGFETPEVFVKEADARRLGGGSDPFDGSFLDDDIAFKLRFTFGADLVDYRGAYFSTGAAT